MSKKIARQYKLIPVKGEDLEQKKITSSYDAFEYLKQIYDQNDLAILEKSYVLMLNRSNNVIGYFLLSQGGTAGTVMDVKIIARYAMKHLCQAIILSHNHPSGNIKPSTTDVFVTNKVKKALDLLDVKVHDHLILTESDFEYFSMGDNGLIENI